jgi:hypothetical protein
VSTIRRPKRAECAQRTRTLQGAAPTHHRDNRGRIVQNDIQLHRQLGRSVVHEAAIKPQEPIQWCTIGDHSSSNLIQSMSLIFQRRHNAKITATAAQRPKKVGIITRAGVQYLAVSHDDISAKQMIASCSVLTDQPAESTA